MGTHEREEFMHFYIVYHSDDVDCVPVGELKGGLVGELNVRVGTFQGTLVGELNVHVGELNEYPYGDPLEHPRSTYSTVGVRNQTLLGN